MPTSRIVGKRIKRKRNPAEEAMQKHALLIGEVAHHWTTLHWYIQQIFIVLIGFDPAGGSWSSEPGTSMWNALKSDDAQRSILLAYARYRLHSDGLMLERLEWLLQRVGELSTYRNDAIHVAFNQDQIGGPNAIFVPVSHGVDQRRVARLNRVGVQNLFKAVRDDAGKLTIYAAIIWITLQIPSGARRPSWPRRPVLRAHALVEKSPPKNHNHQQQPSKPKRPPRA